jgi:hypothetical protein
MTQSPERKRMTSAQRVARIVLNVMYRKTFNDEISVWKK